MTKLLRALMCALPLLAVGAVQAQKSTADTGTTWSRVSTYLENNVPFTVLTVPATATRPYFLRQTFSTTSTNVVPAYTNCYLTVGGQYILPLYSGPVMDLNVPFKAGDVVIANCSGTVGGFWAFVFSY